MAVTGSGRNSPIHTTPGSAPANPQIHDALRPGSSSVREQIEGSPAKRTSRDTSRPPQSEPPLFHPRPIRMSPVVSQSDDKLGAALRDMENAAGRASTDSYASSNPSSPAGSMWSAASGASSQMSAPSRGASPDHWNPIAEYARELAASPDSSASQRMPRALPYPVDDAMPQPAAHAFSRPVNPAAVAHAPQRPPAAVVNRPAHAAEAPMGNAARPASSAPSAFAKFSGSALSFIRGLFSTGYSDHRGGGKAAESSSAASSTPHSRTNRY